MTEDFDAFKDGYIQTYTKTEQLTLIIYMSKGLYQINIKKHRNLYSQKLQMKLPILIRRVVRFIRPVNNSSEVNMPISLKSQKPAAQLCMEILELGFSAHPVSTFS